jgi:hypothetical protein
MPTFIYSAWFSNSDAAPDDQDREWIACIGIDAETMDEARDWGDVLAAGYAERQATESFTHSSIEVPEGSEGLADLATLPRITAGQVASEEAIGW